MKKNGLSMQTLILLAIVPVLMVITVVLGRMVYTDLYQTIILNFERKLLSVGTTANAFIDENEHRAVKNLRQLRGLAYNRDKHTLYGTFFNTAELYIYDLKTGAGKIIDQLEIEALEDIAWDANRRHLYAATLEKAAIYKIDIVTGQPEVVVEIKNPCYGVTYLPHLDQILCNDDNGFVTIDLSKQKNGKPQVTYKIEAQVATVRGLAHDRKTGKIYAVDTHTNELLEINSEDLKVIKRNRLKNAVNSTSGTEKLAYGAFGLAFDERSNTIYSATTIPIVKINKDSLETQYISNAGFNEPSLEKIYSENTEPLMRIKDRSNLTYLYSAVLENRGKNIFYMLDSTQDEIHSFVGYIDPDEAAEKLRDVWFKDRVFLSEIVFWEEWGLLKSVYIPIINSGTPAGYIGSDVNISIIEPKTREALLTVLTFSTLGLIAAVLIAVFISRRLTSPILRMKNMALTLAAGSYEEKVLIENPLELKTLADDFNSIGAKLKKTLNDLKLDNTNLEKNRRRQEAVTAMVSEINRMLMVSGCKDKPVSGSHASLYNASGLAGNSKITIAWFDSEKYDNSFDACLRRTDLTIFYNNLIGKFANGQALKDHNLTRIPASKQSQTTDNNQSIDVTKATSIVLIEKEDKTSIISNISSGAIFYRKIENNETHTLEAAGQVTVEPPVLIGQYKDQLEGYMPDSNAADKNFTGVLIQ